MAEESPDAPSFYALPAGGWRDYVTLLHPPYTAWHLSYVCIGWATAPEAHVDRLVALLAAFFLAVGVGAHALDELNGRPLRTKIPSGVLGSMAVLSIALAAAIGVAGAARTSWWVLAFVASGVFLVVAYNLEVAGGLFHSDLWFGLAWGAFPALTASWAGSDGPAAEGFLAAAACYGLSRAQRTLSTPVRRLRRSVRSVEGAVETSDGRRIPVNREYLRAAPEGALRAISLALPLLAAAVVLARL